MRLSALLPLAFIASTSAAPSLRAARKLKEEWHSVLILGGGVAGLIAARELDRAGVKDYLVIEGRDQLGGRMWSTGMPGTNLTLELGCNWIEGLSSPTGHTNPMYVLAKKHKLVAANNDWEDLSFYDQNGNETTGALAAAYDLNGNDYAALLDGAGERIALRKVDLTARSGYKLSGELRIQTPYDWATEYYNYDWEYAQTPEQSSWIATGNNYNYTFDPVEGFGGDDLMNIDQRGFKTLLLQEAAEFMDFDTKVRLSSIVDRIKYSDKGVAVRLKDGTTINAGHVLVTFSMGVLQSADVKFSPPLPDWKFEAIQTIKMATYTKIFFVFPHKFWHSTEMAIYADPHKRGYYPVWQSLDHKGFFPGSHLYFVTITGDESERVETLSDSQIQVEVMVVLRAMYPKIVVPEPTSMLLHRWHSDPLYRGSWVNWPAGFYTEHMLNIRASMGGRVHFAGEGTSLDYYGYLHGAYFEGLARGTEIGKCIAKGDCGTLPKGPGDFTLENIAFPTVPTRQRV